MSLNFVSLNKMMLIGYLGQDPELRHLPTSSQAVPAFRSLPTRASRVKRATARTGSNGTMLLCSESSLESAVSISQSGGKFTL